MEKCDPLGSARLKYDKFVMVDTAVNEHGVLGLWCSRDPASMHAVFAH